MRGYKPLPFIKDEITTKFLIQYIVNPRPEVGYSVSKGTKDFFVWKMQDLININWQWVMDFN